MYESVSMNYPRFFVYTDPRPIDFPLRETYHPPEHQESLIRQLLEAGFTPLVNGIKQPELSEVHALCGFALLESGSLVNCREYERGKILCIQWYNDPVTDEELEIIRNYCAPFYGIGKSRSYVTAQEQALIDRGCMHPTPSFPLLHEPTFLGNRVILTGDQLSIME